jgi:hypothetical protein
MRNKFQGWYQQFVPYHNIPILPQQADDQIFHENFPCLHDCFAIFQNLKIRKKKLPVSEIECICT